MGGQHGLRNRDGGVVGFLAGEINPGGGVIPRAGDFDWCWDGSGGRGGGRGAVLRKDDDARFVRREIEIEFGAGGFRDLGVEGIPPGDVGSGRAEGGGGMDGVVGSVGEEVDVGEIELAVDEADFGGGGEIGGEPLVERVADTGFDLYQMAAGTGARSEEHTSELQS